MESCAPVWTDETLRELAVHGTEQFPFTCYHSQLGAGTGPCASVPWHWHREVELVLAQRGEAHCLLAGGQLTLAAGEGVFIHAGVIHSFESPAVADIISILFTPEFVAPAGSAVHARCVAPFTATGRSHAHLTDAVAWQAETLADIRALSGTVLAGGPTVELDVHTLVCRMWSRLFRHMEEVVPIARAEQSALMHARLRRMITFIERHFADRLSLSDIAADASISKSEALRCFRRGVQTTPIEYLNRYRLGVARARLLATAAPVTQIAVEAGFSSTAYFDRVFRRSFGIAPAAYRRQREQRGG
jgi:AraC-like DNA-binding protein/mannose-6-phosphate isomerase-like protein (cupin superfamily)